MARIYTRMPAGHALAIRAPRHSCEVPWSRPTSARPAALVAEVKVTTMVTPQLSALDLNPIRSVAPASARPERQESAEVKGRIRRQMTTGSLLSPRAFGQKGGTPLATMEREATAPPLTYATGPVVCSRPQPGRRDAARERSGGDRGGRRRWRAVF